MRSANNGVEDGYYRLNASVVGTRMAPFALFCFTLEPTYSWLRPSTIYQILVSFGINRIANSFLPNLACFDTDVVFYHYFTDANGLEKNA
jgi:hypothetical protein